jgi:hypothetical protein
MTKKIQIDFILGTVVSILVAINGFFIKRLVDEIDATKREVISLQSQVAVIGYRLDIALKDASLVFPQKKKHKPQSF